jgi:hypothetical protein
MVPYGEVFKDMHRKAKQPKVTSFFMKSLSLPICHTLGVICKLFIFHVLYHVMSVFDSPVSIFPLRS